MNDRGDSLSEAEASALASAAQSGRLEVQLYRDGVFSEPDFVLLGVLQRLAIRRRMSFLGLSGGAAAVYTYALEQDHADAAPMVTRNAA